MLQNFKHVLNENIERVQKHLVCQISHHKCINSLKGQRDGNKTIESGFQRLRWVPSKKLKISFGLDRRIEKIDREVEGLERWEREESPGIPPATNRTMGEIQDSQVTNVGVAHDFLPGVTVCSCGPRENLGRGKKGKGERILRGEKEERKEKNTLRMKEKRIEREGRGPVKKEMEKDRIPPSKNGVEVWIG